MQTQVQTLIKMLKRGWVSTGDAFNAGITSYHRRLADLREQTRTVYECESGEFTVAGSPYRIAGKDYRLKERNRSIKSRWGRVTIKEYKLVAVK